MDSSTNWFGYFGLGFGTPGFAVTGSPNAVSEKWNVGLQLSYGASGQGGYSLNDSSWFAELGAGSPGISLTQYYIWDI